MCQLYTYFFFKLQFPRKAFEIPAQRYSKFKKFMNTPSSGDSKPKLYLKLSKKEHSSLYSKGEHILNIRFRSGSRRSLWGLCVFFGRWRLGCFKDSELWSHWHFHCEQCFLWTILQQWNRTAATERLQSLQLEIKQWVPQQIIHSCGKQLRKHPASNEGWV